MKNLLLFLALACLPLSAQVGDITGSALLTSTCTNLHTTCDTAGVTNFNPGSSFSVQGPQTIEVTTQSYGLAQVSATGTYAGSTLNFEFSDDGGTTWYSEICTRTDVNVQEASEALPTNATEAWDCGVGSATKFRVRQSAISSGSVSVRLTLTSGLLEPAPTIATAWPSCNTAGAAFSTAVVALSGTTATQFIAASGSTKIYVCSILLGNGTGTGPLFQLEYGTGANCATGTQTLLPNSIAIPTASGNSNPFVLQNQFAVTPASQALCYLLAGTTPTGTLTITYLQE